MSGLIIGTDDISSRGSSDDVEADRGGFRTTAVNQERTEDLGFRYPASWGSDHTFGELDNTTCIHAGTWVRIATSG